MKYITMQVDHAQKYGINCAIVLHNILFFVLKNKKEKRNKHNGKYWTFNTYENWTESMPFFTSNQIKNALNKLRKEGAVLVGKYNRRGYDKTNWYSVNNAILQKAEKEIYWQTRLKKATDKNVYPSDKIVRPIPNKDTNNFMHIEPY
tara:strand:- start:22916 stop:23356 length:441 start_codon:yes stop_codon:yes gene_type:complete